MIVERIVWRLVGLGCEPEWKPTPVTPKHAILAGRVEANSPLDALVTFTDRYAWRVGECDPVPVQPMPMRATIYADDDPRERLHVTVYHLAEEVPTPHGRRGATMRGVYRIALGA